MDIKEALKHHDLSTPEGLEAGMVAIASAPITKRVVILGPFALEFLFVRAGSCFEWERPDSLPFAPQGDELPKPWYLIYRGLFVAADRENALDWDYDYPEKLQAIIRLKSQDELFSLGLAEIAAEAERDVKRSWKHRHRPVEFSGLGRSGSLKLHRNMLKKEVAKVRELRAMAESGSSAVRQ